MKKKKKMVPANILWPILMVLTDLFFTFLVWIADQNALRSVIPIILLFSVIVISAGCWLDRKKQKIQIEAFQRFLTVRDDQTASALFSAADSSWHPSIKAVSSLLKEQSDMINDTQISLHNYQEFIEEWTHEIKTPLSLAALVLHNHKDEMSPYVSKRMQYVQHMVCSNVDRILYYARLQADHADYKFETMELLSCVEESLQEFHDIAKEKNILVEINLSPLNVVSDRKVLSFMLSQLFSNAFKYTASASGIVRIVGWTDGQEKDMIHLAIRDNGNGVRPEDLPFLFDKGFTGSYPGRQNATGMGLYFVKKYAELLSVSVAIEPESTSGNGFGIRLSFPKVTANQ